MAYDPFARGPFPVGVRTVPLTDGARDGRRLPVEIWYPAIDAIAGADLDARTRDRFELVPGFPVQEQQAVRDAEARAGSFPLVLFSHGFAGHRRQSTFLCTHLASHGYVVAAPDHVGNTMMDLLPGARQAGGKSIYVDAARSRVDDVSLILDAIAAGDAGPAAAGADLSRVAMSGHSFGGFTALAATGRDARIRLVIALAPAGGATPAGGQRLQRYIDFAWQRLVPTLFIAAEEDSILPIAGVRELFSRVVAPKRLVVIKRADHMHFCDAARRIHELFRMLPGADGIVPIAKPLPPFERLVAASAAAAAIRSLTLAQLDAFLGEERGAKAFLSSNLIELFGGRELDVEIAAGGRG